MPTTTNYGWTTPADTDLVKDGASAIRTLGNGVDTTVKNLNPETTLGDISYRSSTANTNTRLAIGTTGQVLTVSGGVPTWANAAAGGMTSLATGSISGSDLTLSSISGSYKTLQLFLSNLDLSANASINLQINGVTASTYSYVFTNGEDAGVYRTNAASSIPTSASYVSSTGTANAINFTFENYAVSNAYKSVSFTAAYLKNGITNPDIVVGGGTVDSSSAINQIKIFPHTGTFTGTYTLYGVS